MKTETLNNVDTTIDNVCKCVNESLCNFNGLEETSTIPDIIRALAELISARANMSDFSQI